MKVLMPLPSRDYDPTEAGVSHAVIRAAGHQVIFATPSGRPAVADAAMLTGIGFDFWGNWPLLRQLPLIGLFLRANGDGRAAHSAMVADPEFQSPKTYAQLQCEDFDALLLPGGHAQGMREYLESAELQALVTQFFLADKPVGAICHGVVLAARSLNPASGKSVLHGRRTTALTWAFERKAWLICRYGGRWWDPHYYRTYLEVAGEAPGHRSVQSEVTRALAAAKDFVDVPREDPQFARKHGGLVRDSRGDSRAAHVVIDGQYVSARWPGDAHTFAQRFVELLK